MNAPGEDVTLHQQVVDWLFARMGGDSGHAPLPAGQPRAEGPPEVAETAPPEVRSADDLKLASDWLRRERRQLEAYTRAQLARIQEEHQAVVGQNYLHEQTLILRSQDLTRKEEMLLAHER